MTVEVTFVDACHRMFSYFIGEFLQCGPVMTVVWMKPAFMPSNLNAAMRTKERRTHAMLIEETADVLQHYRMCPLDVDGKADRGRVICH